MNISQQLAAFACGLTVQDLPEEILDNVRLRIMDMVASAAAGNMVNFAMNDIVLGVLKQQGGQPHSSLFFQKEKLPAAQAAFYNAFVINGADMDDGHMLANGHPGVTVIPPVLALAEWRGTGHGDIAAAIVAGYEVYIRLSNAIMPSHLQRGFNGTGTVGTIAAAAAAARTLQLDAGKTHIAMGLAATSASGLMELNETGQAMKPINPGNAASRGLMCALFAEGGAVAPVAPVDGRNGFFHAFADEANLTRVTEGLGEVFQMDTGYIKLYPACRHVHAMVDCACALHGEGGWRPGDIERAILYTYPASEKLTVLIRHPKSADEAKFSLTYATAVTLVKANFTLDDLTDAPNTSAEIAGLIDRMEIVVLPELEDRARMLRGAKLELHLKNGEILTSCVDVPKGEKVFPLTPDDMRKKFSACAKGMFSGALQDQIFDMTMKLEHIPDLTTYFKLLASGG